MAEIEVRYSGGRRCEAVHGPSGTTLMTDVPTEHGGTGSSFSPTDLLAAALGTCVATTLGNVAERNRIDLTGTRLTVTKEMSAGPPRRIAKLSTRILIPRGLDGTQRTKLERAAHSCPVHQTLRGNVEMTIEFVDP